MVVFTLFNILANYFFPIKRAVAFRGKSLINKLESETYKIVSESFESILDFSTKLMKFTLLPIGLTVVAYSLTKYEILNEYGIYYRFFLGFWSGIFTVLICLFSAYKIKSLDLPIIFKWILQLSVFFLYALIGISGVLIALNKVP